MLMKDRQEYIEGLDFYEVRFEKTLKTLRLDAQRKVYRKEKPLESIDDPATDETAEKVERAAGSFDQLDWKAIADFDSLLQLEEAIDALPELQKAIIEMDRKEIPVESKEPGVVNMANALGKTPKTIRTHRNKAYATLRAALTKGEPR
jgi:DNA-directed RNA polymerase specialized sigma24 family protein